MGMVVRTNMAAINANNSLAQASKAQQNGMQKLASGFKINKAADDASGLAISEKMKNQIKALDTAKDNCEDGANLIQTAEGYMSETHDILNRMTELAEKSANGVLANEDRDALQKEMDELCGEIDRIATTANFNGKKLLDGSLGSTDAVRLTVDADSKTIKYTSPSADVKKINNTGTATGLDIDVSAFKNLKAGTYVVSSDGKTVLNKATNVVMSNVDVSTSFKAQVGDKITISTNGSIMSGDGNNTAGKTANGAIAKTGAITGAVNGATYTFDGEEWVTNDAGVKNTLAATDVILADQSANIKGAEFTITEGIDLQIGESSTAADRLEVKINSFHTDTMFGGLNGFVNTTNDGSDTAATSEVKIKQGNSSSTYQDGVTIDISDKDNASAAADAIRQISNYVSDERGKLGAQQNRLEHTVNNLTTASENTSAANSRIRDTDMAKEMMAHTSKNIIAQAAQTMLAQANSQTQNVLSLLQ